MPAAGAGREPTLSVRVGRRITRLRSDRALSLSALARLSGLSKSTLSDLERGRRTATLDSLFAITTALGAPLSDLLVADADADAGPAIDDQDSVRGAAVTAVLLDRSRTATHIVEVFRIAIGPELQISEPHATGVAEILTVTSGTARVGPTDAPTTLRATETAHYPADVSHSYVSREGAIAILVMLYPESS